MAPNNPTRLLRLRDVIDATGVPRSTIYAWVASGEFPRPRRLGPRAVAWRSDEIHSWIESRDKASA